MQDQETKAARAEISPISDDEDDATLERCPLCKNQECKTHLLACFDASGDEGAFGIGLVDGPLYYVNEIGKVLYLARWPGCSRCGPPGSPRPPGGL